LEPTLAARVVVFVCAASAGAHAGLVPAHLHSEPRLGAAFVVAVVLLASAAVALAIRPENRRAARATAVLLGGLMAAYAATRTAGIPVLAPDPEALDGVGVATNVAEAVGLVGALWLGYAAAHGSRSPTLQEVAR
jgi:apolipoprotein N-acyltransferase